jgi:hypothetical protein
LLLIVAVLLIFKEDDVAIITKAITTIAMLNSIKEYPVLIFFHYFLIMAVSNLIID